MNVGIKIVLALILLLTLFLILWLILPFSGGDDPAVSRLSEPEGEPSKGSPASSELENIKRERLEATMNTFLSGRVVDGDSGEPVTTFLARLKRKEGEWRSKEVARETVTDSQGRFAFPLEEGGRFQLFVNAAGFIAQKKEDVAVFPGEGVDDLVVALEPVRRIVGSVWDAESGFPVEGVFMVASRLVVEEEEGYDGSADSDENGRFTIEGLRNEPYRITACHTDYEETSVAAHPGGEEVLVVIKKIPSLHIYGTVFDDEGRPLPGATIVVWAKDLPDGQRNTFSLSTDENGQYITRSFPPGRVEIQAFDPLVKGDAFEFTQEAKQVRLVDRDVEVDFGPSPGHAAWRGTFYDWEGNPVPRGFIRIRLFSAGEEFEGSVLSRGFRCDQEGGFEVKKLVPGRYQVSLSFPYDRDEHDGYCWRYYSWEDVVIDAPGIFKKDIRLPGGQIHGTIVESKTNKTPGSTFPLMDQVIATHSSGRTFSVYLDKRGRFHLEGLPPGEYTLTAKGFSHGKEKGTAVRLAKNQVIEDVRIELPVSGRARILFEDVNPGNRPSFQWEITRVDGRESHPSLCDYVSMNADWIYWYDLEIGSWVLTVQDGEWGRLKRHFEVFEGETAEVAVRQKDFSDY